MRILTLLFFFSTLHISAAQLIIGIAGGTGSGKTTLSEKIMETFPDRAIVIRQDDYYKDLSHLTFEERAKRNFDHPDAIDFALLREHLLLLKNNQPVQVPIYNFRTNTRDPGTQRVQPAEIVILEGILLFALPEIRELCDLKIFVETDDDIRLLRRMERDMRERGRDFKSVRDQYMTTVKPMHDAFVEPSKRHADVILPTMKRNEKGVALIVASLKKDLELFAKQDQKEIKP